MSEISVENSYEDDNLVEIIDNEVRKSGFFGSSDFHYARNSFDSEANFGNNNAD